MEEEMGDVLVFLTGAQEIESVCRQLRDADSPALQNKLGKGGGVLLLLLLTILCFLPLPPLTHHLTNVSTYGCKTSTIHTIPYIGRRLRVLPMYSKLPARSQMRVFAQVGR